MKKILYFILGLGAALAGTVYAQSIPSQSPFWVSGSFITPTPLNVSLGLKIPSLANQTCLGTDSAGVFGSGTCGSGGTPGGLNTQIQYNNSGTFGGITGATTDGTIVSLNGAHLLNPTINGAGTGLATLTYPNTSTSVTITFPATTNTLATLAGSEALTNKSVNGVTLTTGGSATTFLNGSGTYTTPAGSTFGTTSLSAVSPLQYSTSLAQFSITRSGTGTDGYLAQGDFNTFNNKISSTSLSVTTTGTSGAATYTPSTGIFNIPQYQAAGTYVTGVTATYPIISSGGTTPVISTAFSSSTLTASSPLTGSFAQVGTGGSLGCQTASGSQAGCLSSTDWTTFNNKQPSGTYVTAVNGTTNQITSSGGTTPTLSLPSLVIFPSNATSTYFSTTYGSTTNGFFGTLTIPSLGTPAGQFAAFDPTGKLIGTSTPSGSNSAFSPAANYATVAGLPGYGYVAGVITEVGTGALSVDGANPTVGQIVLVKNESGACTSSSGACNNGLYNVTAAGSGIAAFVLTRNSNYNSSSNVIPGIVTYVISGATLNDDFWAMISASPITIGVTSLNYTEVSGGGSSISSLGPVGALQTGATQTLATTTSSFNGLTVGLTITASGNTQTFQPTLSGKLALTGLATQSANTILGNVTGSTATPTALATSSQLFTGSAGQVTFFNGINSLIGTSSIFINTTTGNVGINNQNPIDTFAVNGDINSPGWNEQFCDNFGTNSKIFSTSAFNQLLCGMATLYPGGSNVFAIATDGSGTTLKYIRTSTPTAAGIGFLPDYYTSPSGELGISTSTPIIQAAVRIITPNLATSSNFYVGLINSAVYVSNFWSLPTSGCYFTASTTQANWQAVCSNGGVSTQVNTGVASSSQTSINGAFRLLRLQVTPTTANFYIAQNDPANFTLVATINTNIPVTVPLHAGIYLINGTNANPTITPAIDLLNARLWWHWLLPQG